MAEEIIDLEQLISDPDNARAHNPRNVGLIEDALREVGAARSIVLDESNVILAGNATWEAAVQAGFKKVRIIDEDGETLVAVRRKNLDHDKKRRLALYDNRTGELADWDVDAIAMIQAEEAHLLKGMFSTKEVERILDQGRKKAEPEGLDEDVGGHEELRSKWGTEPGQLWIIPSKTTRGKEHRLLCADTRNHETWVQLMGGEKGQCVFTDPPYGVEYHGEAHNGIAFPTIASDSLTGDKLVEFLRDCFTEMQKATLDDAAFYIWHAWATRDEYSMAIKASGLIERQYIIWAKNIHTVGHSDYQWAHEPAFYAGKAGQTVAWYGGRGQLTVWRISLGWADSPRITVGNGIVLSDGQGGSVAVMTKGPKGKAMRRFTLTRPLEVELDNGATTVWEVAREPGIMHPTNKPVELAVRAFENSTRPGDIVIDGFTGSGSAAIAAETLGRLFRGVELEPAYIALTLERLARMGLKPERAG